MNNPTEQDPLHGVTLKAMLIELVGQYGWKEMGARINIKCFTHEASISSSLKFLRQTPWARQELEALYVQTKRKKQTPSPNDPYAAFKSKQ